MNQLVDEDLEKIEIELLLEGIYRHYGFDFRNYAYSSIKRRIHHRLQAEKLSSISELQGAVLHNYALMERLLDDFSINVTEMFRDPGFFKSFRLNVVPILKKYPFIRIWHAGCSSGEEVYSMAILLYEEGLFEKTIIYTTDINEKILAKAKKGEFPLHLMKKYTQNYHQAGGKTAFSEYYTATSERVVFHPFLKKNIVFAHHNLATDHSFNEFHVIICRNVMIYFNQTLQNRVFHLFHDSLSSSGFLGLGNKETLQYTNYADKYEEIDGDEKIYRKIKKC
ncbi:CheR family methyltransferase [Desertibacillus haloalkaliphilus]|uniref:CheR family methyltransferase n=1 Tax=Desertibacillus haloalkaliphilus TaxID=1328930 RepID=UPI001C25327A|nr:protein-glutamate O-methyltransferase CheR [Desertibacillus haloalkaliphilus]MBU8907999.1 protein-glutamate O-methyltransferase CheR [Desertibacillus haloalkaliphilus]